MLWQLLPVQYHTFVVLLALTIIVSILYVPSLRTWKHKRVLKNLAPINGIKDNFFDLPDTRRRGTDAAT